MNWNALPQTTTELQQRFLMPEDIAGRPVSLTVIGVTPREFTDKQTGRPYWLPVLTLAGASRQLVCTTAICRAMERYTGTDRFGAWVGYTIDIATGERRNGKAVIMVTGAAKVDMRQRR